MAEMFNPQNPEILDLNRQRKMAELLMARGMETPQGQTVSGGIYVPPSPLKYLANLYSTYQGSEKNKELDEREVALARQLRANETSAMADFFQQRQGRPAVEGGIYGPNNQLTTETTADMYGPDMQLNPQYRKVAPVAAIPANPQAAYANLLANPKASTRLQNMAFEKMNAGPMRVGIDDTLLDPNTYEPIFKGAGRTAPDILTAAQMLGIRGTPDTWTPQQTAAVNAQVMALKRAGATSINMPSGEERKAGFMANILDKNILQMQTALGVDPTAVKPNVPASIVSAIAGENVVSRAITPAQRQIIEDSQLDVLDAALTLRTGAAYTREQLLGMRGTYFPRIGDSPETIKAKQGRLETLLSSAYIASGRATPDRVSEKPPVTPPAPAGKNPPAPAGVAQNVWNVMTPQERSLFK
jgi:hypothetical protein